MQKYVLSSFNFYHSMGNFSRQIIDDNFLIFFQKSDFDISCYLKTICMMCQILFLRKNKTTYFNMSIAENRCLAFSGQFQHRAVSANSILMILFFRFFFFFFQKAEFNITIQIRVAVRIASLRPF